MTTYHVVRFMLRGSLKTALISEIAIEQNDESYAYYLPASASEIEFMSIIEVEDFDLDDVYLSS